DQEQGTVNRLACRAVNRARVFWEALSKRQTIAALECRKCVGLIHGSTYCRVQMGWTDEDRSRLTFRAGPEQFTGTLCSIIQNTTRQGNRRVLRMDAHSTSADELDYRPGAEGGIAPAITAIAGALSLVT